MQAKQLSSAVDAKPPGDGGGRATGPAAAALVAEASTAPTTADAPTHQRDASAGAQLFDRGADDADRVAFGWGAHKAHHVPLPKCSYVHGGGATTASGAADTSLHRDASVNVSIDAGVHVEPRPPKVTAGPPSSIHGDDGSAHGSVSEGGRGGGALDVGHAAAAPAAHAAHALHAAAGPTVPSTSLPPWLRARSVP